MFTRAQEINNKNQDRSNRFYRDSICLTVSCLWSKPGHMFADTRYGEA